MRFDVSIRALGPDLKVVGTARENQMNRDEALRYAERHGIPVRATAASPYSTDENLWGRSVEAGILEDPWIEPPEDVYAWTAPLAATPADAAYVEIAFDHGVPVALDGERLAAVDLVERVNVLAGAHGIGRVDMVEDRLVGIKSREIYEAPAAVTLLEAHRVLESLTLTKLQLRFKERVAQEYADLIYNGLWFTAHHQDLAAYVQSTQRHVTGDVRMRLHRGTAVAAGRRSDRSLYSHALATYSEGDQFDQTAALGFIKLWGLPVEVQARRQLHLDPASDNPLQLGQG